MKIKEVTNKMKLEFLSRSENESLARLAISAFISPLDPTIEELTDVKTAVSEAVTNAIIHGYGKDLGIVTLTGVICENMVSVTISDTGCGICDIKKATEPLFTTSPDGERSGMGFSVMESFMDEIEIESQCGKGTRITMKKYIGGSSDA